MNVMTYYRPSLQARIVRRKNQGYEKLKEKSRLLWQKINHPKVSLLGAFHGTNIGDNALGLSILEPAQSKYSHVSLQNLYTINTWPIAQNAICCGGATGVKENLIDLTGRYQSMPQNVALIGMDFSADMDRFPDEVLTFLAQTKVISCRSRPQAKKASEVLDRDVPFHFDNAFSWSALNRKSKDKIYGDNNVFGFNTLNFFMTWKRHKGFFSGTPLSDWYDKQGSILSAHIENLGLRYVEYINQVLNIYIQKGWKIVHVPCTPEDDLFAKTFFRQKDIHFLPFQGNPKIAVRQISSCTLFLPTRYHSLVFALATQTPCIPFRYSAKCTDLLYDLSENLNSSIDRMELVDSLDKVIEKTRFSRPIILTDEKLDCLSEDVRNSINAAIDLL